MLVKRPSGQRVLRGAILQGEGATVAQPAGRPAPGRIRGDVDLDQVVQLIVAVMDGLQIQWLLDEKVDMIESFRSSRVC